MEYLALLMFPILIVVLMMGFHVAFAMMGVALIFGLFTFGDAVIFQFLEKVDGVTGNFILAAVPLFIFMGAMLERAGIAEKLFDAINLWTKQLPGGLAISTILLCVIFAASAGVVGATEAVVGLLAIPVMLRYGYDKKLISGIICAGGSLGTVIPPSITVIILGPVADVAVGELFAGMVFPGVIIAALYIAYIIFVALKDPHKAPASPTGQTDDDKALAEKLRITVVALLPPIFLIFAVLGTIICGIAAPTEAAAIGALATMILAAIYQKLNWFVLKDVLLKTLKITTMILMIVLGGSMFAGVFIGSGGAMVIEDVLQTPYLGPWGVLLLVLTLTFITGFFLDWISIVLIFIPIFMPVILGFGFDPLWFCVLFLIVIQTSYLTPPLAPAIFYLKGIAPPEIKLSDMFHGVVPFIIMHFIILALIMIAPDIVTWLPQKIVGF